MQDSSTVLGREAASEAASPSPTASPVAATNAPVSTAPAQPAPVAQVVPQRTSPPTAAAPPAAVNAPARPAVPAAAPSAAAPPVAATVAVARPQAAAKASPATAKPANRAPRSTAPQAAPPLPTGSEPEPKRQASLKESITAFVISLTVHASAIIGLAFIVVPAETREEIFSMIVENVPEETKPEQLNFDSIEPVGAVENLQVDTTPMQATNPTNSLEGSDAFTLDINDMQAALPLGTGMSSSANIPLNLKGELGGRGQAAAKAALVKAYGGSEASEAAVVSSLKWLSLHQNANGSWSFDHTHPDCKGSCTAPGSLKECYTGATGIALLTYLGAGQTHEVGNYQETVKKAINFLIQSVQTTPDGGDLRGKVISNEGMYVQGIASIAICEAHAMTHDRRLRRASESAVNFIIRAQDPKGGGWRYTPRQPGDTSVVGWQVMALKSAQAAKIRVPPVVFQGANHFLDHVAVEGGAQYGYDAPAQGNRPATTAVGLLCRMYLGWKRDNPHLKNGVEYLSKVGPSPSDMYYNYYATQVMHHWGEEEWVKWNNVMREMLVKRQIREGHAAGSWPPSGGHSAVGGRLLETCLSAMTLEVYYRHLPIYDRKKIQVEF